MYVNFDYLIYHAVIGSTPEEVRAVYLLDANYHGVVTAVWDDCGVVKTERLTQSGKLACDDAKDLHRTGRRFPEIVNILKQMQEGE